MSSENRIQYIENVMIEALSVMQKFQIMTNMNQFETTCVPDTSSNNNYGIGSSSILFWSVGFKPSKATKTTSENSCISGGINVNRKLSNKAQTESVVSIIVWPDDYSIHPTRIPRRPTMNQCDILGHLGTYFPTTLSTSCKTHHLHTVHQNNIKFSFPITKVTKCWNLLVDTFNNNKSKFIAKTHFFSPLLPLLVRNVPVKHTFSFEFDVTGWS